MLKLIDLNYLRDPKLDSYLSENNFGVLFEYHFMEMSKGNSPVNFKRSLRLVMSRPDRFVVCKPPSDLISITGQTRPVSMSDLIDSAATSNLANFCDYLTHVIGHDLEDVRFEQLTKASKQFFVDREPDALQVIDYIQKSLSSKLGDIEKNELRRMRTVSDDLRPWIWQEALILSEQQLSARGYSIPNLAASLGFRYLLAGYLLCLYWIIAGGLESLPVAKMVNDITDMMYVAISTYFDGLLTNEKKMKWIFDELTSTLRHS